MLFDILAGFVLAISYLVGALIYFGTKDESIPFAEKHKTLEEVMSHSFYLITIAIALVASWLVTTDYKEAAIAIFLIPIIQMSIVSANRKHKDIIMFAVKAAILFFVLFLINYVASSYFVFNF